MPSEDEPVGHARLMLAAGMDTSAHAWAVGTRYVLENPEVLHALQKALPEAMLPNEQMMESHEPEELPFLMSRRGHSKSTAYP